MAKTITKHHSSLSAVSRFITSNPRIWPYDYSSSERASMSWDLNTNYDKCVELARSGWISGAKDLKAGLAQLPAIKTVSRRSYAVVGYKPHVPRALANNPRNMVRKRKSDKGMRPIVSIAVCVSANCNMNAEAMSNYGLAIARYVDELQSRGIRVELLAAIITRVNGVRVVHSWTVKEAGNPMNFADVAFSIGHPACFRRLGFALIERTDCAPASSYGQAQDLEASDIPVDAIILNGMRTVNDHSRTPESAMNYVSKVINDAMAQKGLG